MTTPTGIPDPSRPTEIARLELAHLPADQPLDRIFARACELVADAITVERVGVWLFIDERTVLRCACLYERSRRMHSVGAILRVADFPTYFQSLTIRKAIPAEVANTEPWTAELAEAYLRPLGITSMLDAGIFVDGDLVGVLCSEQVGSGREWTTEARDFVGSMADLLALRVQSAQVRELRAAFLRQENRMVQMDKSAALEQMAAGLAHDFRNLLGALRCQGELLCLNRDLPPDAIAQGQLILRTADAGLALANRLAEFARPGNQTPRVLDIADATREFLPVLRGAIGDRHTLNPTSTGPIGQVLIDRVQYTRILLNLVINAAEAMPTGGTIDLRLLPVRLTGHPGYHGNFVLLEVKDRGCGMDEATLRRACQPHFTTKPQGTGLGLAIVQQVTERAGGLVRLESHPGLGTTVRVFLPRIGSSTGATAEFVVPAELREGGTLSAP